jgi:hypothetical protein
MFLICALQTRMMVPKLILFIGRGEMAKATLSFNLPEDEGAFLLAQRGGEYYCAITEIQRAIRDHNKYGKPMKEVFMEIEQIVCDLRTDDIP